MKACNGRHHVTSMPVCLSRSWLVVKLIQPHKKGSAASEGLLIYPAKCGLKDTSLDATFTHKLCVNDTTRGKCTYSTILSSVGSTASQQFQRAIKAELQPHQNWQPECQLSLNSYKLVSKVIVRQTVDWNSAFTIFREWFASKRGNLKVCHRILLLPISKWRCVCAHFNGMLM